MPRLLCVSDNAQDNLVIADLDAMSIRSTTPVGRGPYPADLIDADLVLVSTRGEVSADLLRVSDGSVVQRIALSHKPRSTTRHPSKSLALVSGTDVALTSVLDTGNMSILSVVGSGQSGSVFDFGGSLACGHPFWCSDDTFIHLDRIDRQLELYNCRSTEPLDMLNLPSSPHHVEEAEEGFLVMCEGSPRSLTSPSILKFAVADGRFSVREQAILPIPPLNRTQTGGHHLTVDAPGDRIFVGTNEGRLYILRLADLAFLSLLDTDAGCGHVTLCPEIGLGVTTNHTAMSMTVFDLTSGRVTGAVNVSGAAVGNKKTQGHTSKWFPSEGRLVTTASQESRIVEIDPAARTITREIHVAGGYLIQGCFA